MLKRSLKRAKVLGFTLIELAIILIFIGLLGGAGVSLLGMLTEREKFSENKKIIDSAVEAIKGYALENGKLPTLSNFTSIVNVQNDAWGKPLIYIYYVNATSSSICGLTSSPITVRYCYNAACTSYNDTTNVAFLVLSSGENMNIQTGFSSQNISSNTTIKVYDYWAVRIDDYSADVARVELYDDMVKVVTLYELQSLLRCGGGGGGRGSENRIVFDRPGTYTWQVPSGVNEIIVTGTGAGGGGGGGDGGGGGGGGGGSGSACIKYPIKVVPGEILTITIGAGGAGGGSGGRSGSSGGNTTISGSISGTLLILYGGAGGGGGSGFNGGNGGAGGGVGGGAGGAGGASGSNENLSGGAGGAGGLGFFCLTGAGGGGGGAFYLGSGGSSGSGGSGGPGGLFVMRYFGGPGGSPSDFSYGGGGGGGASWFGPGGAGGNPSWRGGNGGGYGAGGGGGGGRGSGGRGGDGYLEIVYYQ